MKKKHCLKPRESKAWINLLQARSALTLTYTRDFFAKIDVNYRLIYVLKIDLKSKAPVINAALDGLSSKWTHCCANNSSCWASKPTLISYGV
jgi:hypothetical protein